MTSSARELPRAGAPVHIRALLNVWAWPLLIVVVLGLDAAVLHLVAERTVAPYYPRGFDQVQYLTESYRTHETLRDLGLVRGLGQAMAEPRAQGWLLQLEAAVLFWLTGPGRLPALDLNLAHLLLFLGISTVCLRRRFGPAAALAFLGLTLSARAVTAPIGGPFDFRLDFATMCAWGALVALLALGGEMRTWRQVVGLVLLGELVISLRTIGLVYLLGTLAGLFALAPLALGPMQRARVGDVRRRLLVPIAVWSATEALFVARNFTIVRDYYIGGHVQNAEKSVRALEVGAVDLLSATLYYVRAVATDHLGTVCLVSLAALGLFSAMLAGGKLLQRRGAPDMLVEHDAAARWSLVVLPLAIVLPYAALTLDESKSSVVGNVLLPPVLLLAVVVFAVAARNGMWLTERTIRRAVLTIGAATLLVGVAAHARYLRTQLLDYSTTNDVGQASRFIDQLSAEISTSRSGQAAVWAVDAHLDFAAAQAVRVYYYEQHGQWLPIVGGLGEGAIYSTLAPEEVRQQGAASDVLILSRRLSAPTPVYPYDLSIEAAEPLLSRVAVEEFDLRNQGTFFGREVRGFIRRVPRAVEFLDAPH